MNIIIIRHFLIYNYKLNYNLEFYFKYIVKMGHECFSLTPPQGAPQVKFMLSTNNFDHDFFILQKMLIS